MAGCIEPDMFCVRCQVLDTHHALRAARKSVAADDATYIRIEEGVDGHHHCVGYRHALIIVRFTPPGLSFLPFRSLRLLRIPPFAIARWLLDPSAACALLASPSLLTPTNRAKTTASQGSASASARPVSASRIISGEQTPQSALDTSGMVSAHVQICSEELREISRVCRELSSNWHQDR